MRAHGATQLQIKAYYPFENRRRSRYRMDMFITVPRQISLRTDEDGRRLLLEDTHSDTRFTVTNLPFSLLADDTHENNPLCRIKKELDDPGKRWKIRPYRIEYETRTFCNLFTVQIKGTVAMVCGLLDDPAHRDEAITGVKRLVRESKSVIDVFRAVRQRLIDPTIPESLRDAHILADEYLGDRMVRHLLSLAAVLENRDIDRRVSAQLHKAVAKELAYQTERGYSAVRSDTISPDDAQALETLVVREGRLKKWVQSVLYLNVAESGTPRQIGHILASIAAALAMSIAVLTAFFADRLYASYSVPWALLIVGSYILKDRIKEVLRSALVRHFPVAIADRTRILKDPANQERVGRARMAIRNARGNDTPGADTPGRSGPLPGTVPYRTIVIAIRLLLRGRRLLTNHRRVNGVVDITRIRLDQWLRDMDSPHKGVRLFVDRKPVLAIAPRTYRIRLAVSLSQSGTRERDTQSWTIVLTKDGIFRIERDREP
ncbi:MAG: hypothetical protein MI724_12815 [Spirochaetales bacterium]|nr:hypothetical protein [Spirochaetales bacterium]